MKASDDDKSSFSGFSGFSGAEEISLDEPPRPLMRELPPATEYPVEALGSIMSSAAKGIHDKTQAAIALCAQSILATAAVATQIHRDVTLPSGQKRPTSSYLITVAESGDRKSSADELATKAIAERQKNLRDEHAQKSLDYQNEKTTYEKTKEAVVKKHQGDRHDLKRELDRLGPPPRPPLEPHLIATDPTIEGLYKQFGVGQPGLGIFSSEGGQFIAGHAMNVDNRIKTAAGFSSLWDGHVINRVRAGDGAITLVGRRLSMHLMAQPLIAMELLGDVELANQGLLSRVLVSAPPSPAGTRRFRESTPESDAAISRFGRRALGILELPTRTVDLRENELDPVPLGLNSKARAAFIAFSDAIEVQIGPDGGLDRVRGLANKIAEHAVRIAAIISTIETGCVAGGEINFETMAAGIEIAQYHLDEALRLFEAKSASGELIEAQKLLCWLQRGSDDCPLVSLPDIYQFGPNSVRTKAHAEGLVRILVDHGWLVDAGPNRVKGLNRRETFKIVRGDQ
jgi:Protein of unknown function (DUF3987)